MGAKMWHHHDEAAEPPECRRAVCNVLGNDSWPTLRLSDDDVLMGLLYFIWLQT